jgi:predicted nucleic acid-binding protein
VLIYLINKNEIQKQTIVHDFLENKNVFISTQNLKEFSNVMLLKTNSTFEEIYKQILIFSKQYTLLPELPTDIIIALKLTKNRQIFYDALLVATMKRNGINTIVTENEKDFADFEEINVINPFK